MLNETNAINKVKELNMMVMKEKATPILRKTANSRLRKTATFARKEDSLQKEAKVSTWGKKKKKRNTISDQSNKWSNINKWSQFRTIRVCFEKRCLPSIKLDNLDSRQNFIQQPNTIIHRCQFLIFSFCKERCNPSLNRCHHQNCTSTSNGCPS